MKAVFEVKEIIANWNPPFTRNENTEQFSVTENEAFSPFNGSGENVFRLIKMGSNRALVEFSRQFTLKGYENPGTKQLWLALGEEKSFTFLWGEKGITKKLSLKSFEADASRDDDDDAPEDDGDDDDNEDIDEPDSDGDGDYSLGSGQAMPGGVEASPEAPSAETVAENN